MADEWIHKAALAVRFRDHFFGEPIPEELPVRLGTPARTRPITAPDGSHRQADGTYRFINLTPGRYRVLWTPPLQSNYASWTAWGEDVEVALPEDRGVVERQLWPTPTAPTITGITGIRGKLLGPHSRDNEVRIGRAAGGASGRPRHKTRSDAYGEFLFLIPWRIEPVAATHEVRLRIRLDRGNVVDGAVSSGTVSNPFVGSNFNVPIGVYSRVFFRTN